MGSLTININGHNWEVYLFQSPEEDYGVSDKFTVECAEHVLRCFNPPKRIMGSLTYWPLFNQRISDKFQSPEEDYGVSDGKKCEL